MQGDLSFSSIFLYGDYHFILTMGALIEYEDMHRFFLYIKKRLDVVVHRKYVTY